MDSFSKVSVRAVRNKMQCRTVSAMLSLLVTLFAVPIALAANTVDNYTGSSTGSLLTAGNWSGGVPDSSKDAVFTVTTGIRTLTAGNLTVGSFNATGSGGAGTFGIRNETSTATDSVLTLGGVSSSGNSVSGNSADLLYVASGSTLNIFGPNGGAGTGVLNVVLGQSGNFNAAGTLNITAAISGTGFGITKTGNGTLTLGGANTYTGTTTVSLGTLALTGSLSSSSALTLNGNALFNRTSPATSSVQQLGTLSFNAGDGNVQSTYGIGGGTEGLTFASMAARGTYATGNFVVSGGTNGTNNNIVLTGQTTGVMDRGIYFAGGTASANFAYYDGYVRGINYGVDSNTSTTSGGSSIASVGYAQATGAVTAQQTATFTGLNLVNTTNTARAFTLAAGQTVTVDSILRSGNGGTTGATTISGGTGIQAGANTNLIIRTDMANDLLAISTPILANGTNALIKSGAGTLTLGSTTNNLTGGLYLNSGIVGISADGALGAAGAGITFNGGRVDVGVNNLTFAAGRTITLNAGGGMVSASSTFVNWTTTINSNLAGSGNLTINNDTNGRIATVNFGGDNSGFTGSISMPLGTIQLNGASAGGTGPISFTSGFSAYTLKLRNDVSGAFTFSSLSLPATNTAATLDVGRLSSGTGQTLTMNALSVVGGGGTINVTDAGGNGYSLAIGTFSMSSNGPSVTTTFNPTSANVAITTANITKGIIILGGSGTTNSVGQVIATASDAGGVKVTGGTWTLSGTNNYGFGGGGGDVGSSFGGSGTEITGGKLIVSSDANLGAAPTTVKTKNLNISGGTLSVSESFTLATNRGLGIGPRSGTTGGTATLEVADTKTLTYNGVISNAGNTGTNSLSKTGNGKLVLGGQNSYNGLTQISQGTVEVVGTGKLGAGNVTLGAGTVLKLNNSVGGTVDELANTATLTLASTAKINLAFTTGGIESVGVLDLGGTVFSSPITFTFASGYTEGGTSFASYFAGSTGGDLTVVPEPAGLALFTLGTMALLFRRRRKEA